jgi:hypothetical protein
MSSREEKEEDRGEQDYGGGGDEDQRCGVRSRGLFWTGWGFDFGRRRGRLGGNSDGL